MLVFRDYVDCFTMLRPILAPTIAAVTDNTQLPPQIIRSDIAGHKAGSEIESIINMQPIMKPTALHITGAYQTLFGNVLHIKKQAIGTRIEKLIKSVII